jgi:hypothetical protein
MQLAGMTMANNIHPHLRCFVCIHVFQNTRPVLLVSRPDGDWCFLCGDAHPNEASSYSAVGIGDILERDAALLELQDLEVDWEAERQAVGKPWFKTKCVPD